MDKKRKILVVVVIVLMVLIVAGMGVLLFMSDHKVDTPTEPSTSTADRIPNTSRSEPSDEGREFTVNILLAPKGYQVECDYEIEIAHAADVNSPSDMPFDQSDEIFYSASVINGRTKLKLTDGKYVVCIHSEDEPKNIRRYEWTIDKDTTDKDLTLIVTEALESGQMQVVLKWGELPNDIDLHFVSEAEHIKPLNPEGNDAHMDTDSRTGNGIECITITDTSESFHCLVNNWSQEVPLSRSKAQVLVFTYDHSQPYIFDVPDSMQNVWDVCVIEDAQVMEVGKEGTLESRDNPLPAQ